MMRIKFKIPLRLIVILIFLTAWLAHRVSPLHGSDNDLSRLAGIIAVARYRELPIDKTIHKITVDRVEYNGHKYSSKPPVLHVFLGEIIHFGFQVKPVLLNNAVAIYRASSFISTVLPLVGIFIVFFYLLKIALNIEEKKSIFASLYMVLGTLLFSYSRYLTNHILEAFLQLSLFSMLTINHGGKPRIQALLYGILLSAITVIDLTFGFIAVPITLIYLFFRKRTFLQKNFFVIGIASLPLLIAHFYLNWVQFHTLLPPQLMKEVYFNYPNSTWTGNVPGIEAQNHPLWLRFFNYTFGTYGIFLYQPVLLFALAYRKFKRDPVWLYVTSITFAYISFNAIMQSDYGGASFGPRRFLPLIPMLMYFAIKNIAVATSRRKFASVIIAATLTWLVSLLGSVNTWGNWNYFMHINDSRQLYFPLLFTLRKVLKHHGLEHLLDFVYTF